MAIWKWVLGAVGTGGLLLLIRGARAAKEQREQSKELGEKVASAATKQAKDDGGEASPEASQVIRKGVMLINLGRINEYQLEAVYLQLQSSGMDPAFIGHVVELAKKKQPRVYRTWQAKRKAPAANRAIAWMPKVKAAMVQLAKGSGKTKAPTVKQAAPKQKVSPDEASEE